MKRNKALGTLRTLVVTMAVISLVTSCGEYVQPQKVGDIHSGTTATSKETPKGPEVYKIGDKIKLKDHILTVLSAGETKSNNMYMKPTEGKKYYFVEVEIENSGSEPIQYNLLSFKIADDKSYTFDSTFVSTKEPSLGSGTLQATRKTRGFVNFEITKDATGLEMLYKPNLFDSSEIIVKL